MTRPLVALYWVNSNHRQQRPSNDQTDSEEIPISPVVEDNPQPKLQDNSVTSWQLLKDKLALRMR
jgi:hypothetical protein